jgi:16S rRNA (uracil1498-N3)-methyltransferase
MAERFFVIPPIDGPRVSLTGAEAHHLTRVMRGQPGDEVILFDGCGAEFLARIKEFTRRGVALDVIEQRHVDRELPVELCLGVALPKGDRQRWLVEKAVELGVTRLVPLLTARAVASTRKATAGRLSRCVVEASKQCGRNRLMHIADPCPWVQYVETSPSEATRIIAHRSQAPIARMDGEAMIARGNACWLAVGPEGGLTDDEVLRAREHGWQILDLGPRILRVETAALAMAASVSSYYSFSSARV